MIYLDNAATTYPKPESVYKALDDANRNQAFNAGRGSYKVARDSSKLIDETKKAILKLLHGRGNESEFVEYVAQDVLLQLSDEDKDFLLEHPDPIDHHFGLGLYIRNNYIHGKKLGFFVFRPDSLSTTIVGRVIEIIQDEKTGN